MYMFTCAVFHKALERYPSSKIDGFVCELLSSFCSEFSGVHVRKKFVKIEGFTKLLQK